MVDSNAKILGADELLRELSSRLKTNNGSDLHLQEGELPALRIVAGLTSQTDLGILIGDVMREILSQLLNEEQLEKYEKSGAVDAGVNLHDMRLRLAAFKHFGGVAISLRRFPAKPPTFQDINLPLVIKRFAKLGRGLVIFCGPTGCGKSTTASAIIHMINSQRRAHIITIEEPIEFVHRSKTSLVAQREVGIHTTSFACALREALREDPDVLLVGEMRDRETIELALTASETGHLVFSTLHTAGAAGSISRIIDAFDSGTRDTIRTQLSMVLEGVVSQILVPTKDGSIRVPICEVLIPNDAVRHLIRENKIEQIPNIIQSGGHEGMLSFNAHIQQLVKESVIDVAGGLDAVNESWRLAEALEIGNQL